MSDCSQIGNLKSQGVALVYFAQRTYSLTQRVVIYFAWVSFIALSQQIQYANVHMKVNRKHTTKKMNWYWPNSSPPHVELAELDNAFSIWLIKVNF